MHPKSSQTSQVRGGLSRGPSVQSEDGVTLTRRTSDSTERRTTLTRYDRVVDYANYREPAGEAS